MINKNTLVVLSLISLHVQSMELRPEIPSFYLGTITNNSNEDITIVDADSQKAIEMVPKRTQKKIAALITLNQAHKVWFKKLIFHDDKNIYMEINHELSRLENHEVHNSSVFLYYKTKYLKNPVMISQWTKDNYRVHEQDYVINVTLGGVDLKDSHLDVGPLQQTTRKDLAIFEQ